MVWIEVSAAMARVGSFLRAMRFQQRNHRRISFAHGRFQGRDVIHHDGIHIGSSLDQEFRDSALARRDGAYQGSHLILVPRINPDAGIKQDLRRFHLTHLRGDVQSGRSDTKEGGFEIRPAFQQELEIFHPAILHRIHHRGCFAWMTALDRVDVRLMIEQQSEKLNGKASRCEMQRSPPILRRRIYLSSFGEQQACYFHISRRGGKV